MDASSLAAVRPPSHPQPPDLLLPPHQRVDDRYEAQDPTSPLPDSRLPPARYEEAPPNAVNAPFYLQSPPPAVHAAANAPPSFASHYKPSPSYQQPPLQKVYVDWPTERDEEEFRFVSSRLADVEDSQEPIIRSQDLYRADDVIPPAAALPVDARPPPGGQSERPDDDTLRQEMAYQEEMRRRLQRQQEELAQLSSVVPPLNLSRTSTPREEGARDSLDISLRSESEDEEEKRDAGALAVMAVAGPGDSHGQRLSAQHRAEMTQLLSSLGGDAAGPELAIDKELYASTRSRQAAPETEAEMEENLEFLRKIHDYNEALRAQVQEDMWNSHASSAAEAKAGGRRGRKDASSAPRVLTQDFVQRNKHVPAQMQRSRSKSYSERYRERHSPPAAAERPPRPPAKKAAPPDLSRAAHQPIREEAEAFSVRAPLGPIPVAPGLTLDVNLHILPRARDAAWPQTERQREWAFVHDPEHAFQPPSPRAHLPVRPPRLNYDEQLLQQQAAIAASFARRSPLPPIARQPESAPRREVVRSPPRQGPGSYLDAFRQSQGPAAAQYREYTLREYKHLRSIAAMGGLGPDFDSDAYKAQKNRTQRRKQYAQQVGSRNREEMSRARRAPSPNEQRRQERFVAMDKSSPSKRQLMLDYMKGLEQRHHVVQEEKRRLEELQVVRPTEQTLQKKVFDSADLDEILNDTEFEKLKRRHEHDRAAQESIRHQRESSRSQVAATNR